MVTGISDEFASNAGVREDINKARDFQASKSYQRAINHYKKAFINMTFLKLFFYYAQKKWQLF